MPVIPFQRSEQSIPGTAGVVYMPSDDLVGAAVAKAGAQIAQTSEQFYNVLSSQKAYEEKAKQHTEAQKAGNDFQENFQLILEAQADNSDWTAEDVRESFRSVSDNITKNITDPLVLRSVKEYAANLEVDLMPKARLLDVGRQVEKAKAEDIRSNAILFRKISDVSDWNEAENLLMIRMEEIIANTKLNYYDETDAQILMDKTAGSAAETFIESKINTNPAEALAILNDKKNSIVQYLDPINKVPELIAKAEYGGKKQNISSVAAELTDSFSLSSTMPNWEGAIKELYKTDNLKRWNISFQESQQIFSDLHARWALDQQQQIIVKKQLDQEIKNTAVDLASKGKFKEAFEYLDKSALDKTDVYDIKQKVITDQREDAHYGEWLSRDNAEKIQKKAEKWLINNVRGDKAGFAIQTYRQGIEQQNLGADRFEEYARQIAAMPEYDKKTTRNEKLANILGLKKDVITANQTLRPTPLRIYNLMSEKIKAGLLTRKQAIEQTMQLGYDADKLEETSKK